MGLILDSSLLIADERENFDLAGWLRGRPPEPVAVSAITFSQLWFGIDADENAARARRRRRWLEKTFRRLEVVPLDSRVARIHSRAWAQLSKAGQIIGSPIHRVTFGPGTALWGVGHDGDRTRIRPVVEGLEYSSA